MLRTECRLDKLLTLLKFLDCLLVLLELFVIGAGGMQRHDFQVYLAVVLLI